MPRTPARRFNAQEPTIYRDLTATMRAIGASSLRVGTRDMLNEKDVAAEVSFDLNGARYVARCKKWPHYLDNLRAVERTIYYLHRAVSEYGATSDKMAFDKAVRELFAGLEATPDDAVLALGSGNKPWWQVLGLQNERVSKQDVISAYRALAKVHHPDHGGLPETYRMLRRAYEEGLRLTS